jgi:hypothetical protein
LEECEVLPPKPIPHTQAALSRTDLGNGLVVAATRTSPYSKKSHPTRHHHIIERRKIIFATVALYAHGASPIGGSTKLATPVDRSSYLARAYDKLFRLTTSPRNQPDVRTTPHSLPRLPTLLPPQIFLTILTIFPLRHNNRMTTQPIWRRTHTLPTYPTKPRGSSLNLLNVALMDHQQPHLKQRIMKSVFSPTSREKLT